MTKKDYIIIAKTLKEVKDQNITLNQKITFDSIVKRLANIFIEDNKAFDIKKFNAAIYD